MDENKARQEGVPEAGPGASDGVPGIEALLARTRQRTALVDLVNFCFARFLRALAMLVPNYRD